MKIKKIISFLFLTALMLMLAPTVYGATNLLQDIPCAQKDGADCTICNFLQLFVNGADIMVALSGTFAILMFIYGGVTWITSYGNEARVKQGREIIIATVTGIVIVLMAWTIVNLIVGSLGAGKIDWINADGMCAA